MIEGGLGPGSKNVYIPSATMTNTLVSQVGPENRAGLTGLRGTTLATGGTEFEKRLSEIRPDLQDTVYAAQAY
ncbi:MAG: ABC transporter substrate-binding protein, partial [Actinomycetes bacterium]